MRAWIKKAAIGGLWGLITGIIVLLAPGAGAMGIFREVYHLKDFVILPSLFLIFMPAWIASLIAIILFFLGIRFIPFINIDTYALTPFLSIILGILLLNKVSNILTKLKATIRSDK